MSNGVRTPFRWSLVGRPKQMDSTVIIARRNVTLTAIPCQRLAQLCDRRIRLKHDLPCKNLNSHQAYKNVTLTAIALQRLAQLFDRRRTSGGVSPSNVRTHCTTPQPSVPLRLYPVPYSKQPPIARTPTAQLFDRREPRVSRSWSVPLQLLAYIPSPITP